MNWDAISAVAELAGVLALIISIIYLAIQVRIGSNAVSTNVRDSVFSSLQEWNYQLTADPHFASMFHKGLGDFESLEVDEQLRFLHTLYGFFKLFENIYLHYLEGSVAADLWIQNREIVYSYSRTPGAQYYLSARRSAFDSRFLNEIEALDKPSLTAGDIVARGTNSTENMHVEK